MTKFMTQLKLGSRRFFLAIVIWVLVSIVISRLVVITGTDAFEYLPVLFLEILLLLLGDVFIQMFSKKYVGIAIFMVLFLAIETLLYNMPFDTTVSDEEMCADDGICTERVISKNDCLLALGKWCKVSDGYACYHRWTTVNPEEFAQCEPSHK